MSLTDLTIVQERLDRISTVRIAADRLPRGVLAECRRPLAWAVYSYRDHRTCEQPTCDCQQEGFAGDGAIVLAYADGTYGIHPLRHGRADPPLRWGLMDATALRLPASELAAVRDRPLTGHFLHWLARVPVYKPWGLARWKAAQSGRLPEGFRPPADEHVDAMWRALSIMLPATAATP